MFDQTTSWILGVGVSLALGALFAFRRGAEVGLGVAVITSLAFPVWQKPQLLGLPLGVRTVVAAVALLAYAVRFPRRIWSPLTVLDGMIASLVIVHAVSDSIASKDILASCLHAYGEWALPYVAGRYALRGAGAGTDTLARWVCGLLILLAAGTTYECLNHVNLWEQVFGSIPAEGRISAQRFGLLRASGPTAHPIFYGLALVALAPWPLSLFSWERDWQGKLLPLAAALSVLAGLLSTISRGPVLAYLGMFALALAARQAWARWVVGIGVLLLGVVISLDPMGFLKQLEDATAPTSAAQMIEIDGKTVPVNSTLVRVWLYQAYAPALRASGALGNGSHATEEFPVNVPRMPSSAKTVDQLKWVDNAYLLIGLRFGWIGLTILGLWLAANIWTGWRLSSDRADGVFGLWTGSMFIMIALTFLTVWMCYDFGFELLWMSGALAGMFGRGSGVSWHSR